jgi:hypothetical protein
MCRDIDSEGLVHLQNLCRKISSEATISQCETISPTKSSLSPGFLRDVREHHKSIRALVLDFEICHDEVLSSLIESTRESPLRVFSFRPKGRIDSAVYDKIDQAQENYKNLQVIVIPSLSQRWPRWNNALKGFSSIITVETKTGHCLDIATRRLADLPILLRHVHKDGRKVKKASLFRHLFCSLNTSMRDLAAIGAHRPIKIEKLYLHSFISLHIKDYIDLEGLVGVACVQNIFDDDSAEGDKLLFDSLVSRKVAAGNTHLEELIHVVTVTKRTGTAAPSSIPEATLINLTDHLTGVKTFCWHQNHEYTKPLGDHVANWIPTLENLSFRGGTKDMSYDEMRGVFEKAPHIMAFGCNHNLTGALMQREQLDYRIRNEFQKDVKEIAVSKQTRNF